MVALKNETVEKSELLEVNRPSDMPAERAFPEVENKEDTLRDDGQCCSVPKRYIIIILLFVGMVIVHAQRVNVGVTVVSLLDESHHHGPAFEFDSETTHELSQLHWTSHMVGWLHSIFYVGLLISQVPCGYIVTKLPSHRLFGASCLATFMLNFFIPLSITRLGYGVTCTIRLFQGLVEGLVYPSCYDVLRHWTLPEERSRMGASVLTGSYIGPTVGMVFSGLITYYAGWPYVFYVHGGVGLLWYVFWLVLVFATPSAHPTITEQERRKMEEKQGETSVQYENEQVPWKDIFLSLPVYALIVCNFARSFVFYMLLTNQPAYLNIFKFSIAENGLFASLPHAFMALFCVISGSVADYLWSQSWLSATFIRKLLTCLGFGIEALFFFGLSLVSDRSLAVAFLTAGVGISGIAISGWQINHLDLAPRYAGILVAITMTFGTLAGVTNPIIVATLTQSGTLASWQNVFWLTGLVLAGATIFYAIFGSGERQSWATPRAAGGAIIIPKSVDPLSSSRRKPYGTFHAQYNDPPPYDSLPSADAASEDDDEIMNSKPVIKSQYGRTERVTHEPGGGQTDMETNLRKSAFDNSRSRVSSRISEFDTPSRNAPVQDNESPRSIPLMDLTISQPQYTEGANYEYPSVKSLKSKSRHPSSGSNTGSNYDQDNISSQNKVERTNIDSNRKKVDVGHVDDRLQKNLAKYDNNNSQSISHRENGGFDEHSTTNDFSQIKHRSNHLDSKVDRKL